MKPYFWIVFFAVAAFMAISLLTARKRRRRGRFTPRDPVTKHEQGMYWRLVEAFPPPEFVVLSQVSFGALLAAKDGASRYSFSQKIADFVLLNKSFKVLAVIELDDSSHKGREQHDASRDAMLTEAGYRVLRYKHTPNKAQLTTDIPKPPAA